MENQIEIWKDIIDFEGLYQISSFGNVKSLPRIIKYKNGRHRPFSGCLIKGGKTPTGYVFVNLKKEGYKESNYIHRLVAEYFLQNIENKPTVNHKDGDKSNNHYSNLEWCTHSENTIHAFNTDLMKKGQDCSYSKLTEYQVLEILENKQCLMKKELAEIYGVSKSCIGSITFRKTWKHLNKI